MSKRNREHVNEAHIRKISRLGAKAKADKQQSFFDSLGVEPDKWRHLTAIMRGANQRCSNPNDEGYKNYGGRGIEFRFPSTHDGALWVYTHLGLPPKGHSIDRINNEGHYEPGNLRWADRKTQNANKRSYARNETGERIRHLQAAGSPYSYESLRSFIKSGLTDEQILSKVKYAHSRL